MSTYPTRAQLEEYIRQRALRIGIDPSIALRVAKSEGLNANPAEAWRSTYRNKAGIREPSYTPYQLLVGGPGTGFPKGMGNDFMAATGLDPRNPSNVYQGIDYALSRAKSGGWSPWYGAAKVGVGKWDGIRNVAAQGGLPALATPKPNIPATPNPNPATGGIVSPQPFVQPAGFATSGMNIPVSNAMPQVMPMPNKPTPSMGGLFSMLMMQKMAQPAQPTKVVQDTGPGLGGIGGEAAMQAPFSREQLTGRTSQSEDDMERRRKMRRAY